MLGGAGFPPSTVVVATYTPPPPRSLTAKAPEKRWLEDKPFLLGRFIFGGELLNFGGGNHGHTLED